MQATAKLHNVVKRIDKADGRIATVETTATLMEAKIQVLEKQV